MLHTSSGSRERPQVPNSFNFMQFLGKFGKIICWRSHLGEILDPPLHKERKVLFKIVKRWTLSLVRSVDVLKTEAGYEYIFVLSTSKLQLRGK